MPKGPKVHPEIEKLIASLVWLNPFVEAGQIEQALIDKFVGSDIPIPAIRTIQDRAKRIRDRMSMQEKPWSMAAMAEQGPDVFHGKTGIPWEAAGFIMQSIVELESIIRSGKKKLEELWPHTFELLTYIHQEVNQPEKAPQQRTVLTNRQGKWLWRIHLVLPGLKPVDLFPHVDAYVQRELLADYLGWDFDTSDLDSSLQNILRDVIAHGYYPDRSQPDENRGGTK